VALTVTPIYRNLHTRVTFLGLEFEDLFVVLAVAALMNVVGRFAAGGWSAALQYGVPVSIVPLLALFKYGKPRGYVRDLALWHVRPRAYSAAGRDPVLREPYIVREEE